MITTHTHKDLTWLDLKSPTNEEITGIVKRYNLNPLVGEELARTSGLTRVNFYKSHILVVLTLPVRIRNGNIYEIVDRELDVVIGKDFIVTSRDETIEQLEYFSKIFDANLILDKDMKLEHAGHLFYYIVKRMHAGMYQDLENIKDSLRDAESHIFKGDEKAMVEVLSYLSRELIDFKQTVHAHHDMWAEITAYAEKNKEKSMFGPEFHEYAHAVKDEAIHINEVISNARELLTDLRETNDALLNTKQNEIIKFLTLVSFIFYPITFIASLFTIPGIHVPLTTGTNDWWIIVGIMAVVTIAIAAYFKKRDWV